jgi:flagellar hook-length control protein FliK
VPTTSAERPEAAVPLTASSEPPPFPAFAAFAAAEVPVPAEDVLTPVAIEEHQPLESARQAIAHARTVASVAQESDSREASAASRSRIDIQALRAQIAAALAPIVVDAGATGTSGGYKDSADDQSSALRSPRPAMPPMHRNEATAVPLAVPETTPSDAQNVNAAVERPRLPNEAAVEASIVRSMQWQYRHGVGSAVVNLDPGYLGHVTIALQIERGVVTATLHAANAEVRAWMQANEGSLRQGLSDQGLSLDRLVVFEDEPAEQSPSQHSGRQQSHEQEQRRPRRTPRPEETTVFDVIV